MIKNSSNNASIRVLANVSQAQAERFLRELANLDNDAKAAAQFERRFGWLLPGANSSMQTVTVDRIVAVDGIDSHESISHWKRVDFRYSRVFDLRNALRRIWETTDLKTREWRILLFAADLTMSVSFAIAVELPLGPFQQTIPYLLKWASKMRLCHNPECPAAYFFAGRKSQKYCTEDCALPSQREHKRRWWSRNGEGWRNARMRKTKSKAGLKR